MFLLFRKACLLCKPWTSFFLDLFLQSMTLELKGLQGVTGCFKGLQGVTGGYKGLQVVTAGDKVLQGVQRIIETFF